MGLAQRDIRDFQWENGTKDWSPSCESKGGRTWLEPQALVSCSSGGHTGWRCQDDRVEGERDRCLRMMVLVGRDA